MMDEMLISELAVILIPDDICFELSNISDFVSLIYKYTQMSCKTNMMKKIKGVNLNEGYTKLPISDACKNKINCS